MSKPQFIRTEAGEEFVVLSRRDYDAMRARLGDEDAEDRLTARIVKEAKASCTITPGVMFLAVTVHVRLDPSSPCATVYVDLPAPEIGVPLRLQR